MGPPETRDVCVFAVSLWHSQEGVLPVIVSRKVAVQGSDYLRSDCVLVAFWDRNSKLMVTSRVMIHPCGLGVLRMSLSNLSA